MPELPEAGIKIDPENLKIMNTSKKLWSALGKTQDAAIASLEEYNSAMKAHNELQEETVALQKAIKKVEEDATKIIDKNSEAYKKNQEQLADLLDKQKKMEITNKKLMKQADEATKQYNKQTSALGVASKGLKDWGKGIGKAALATAGLVGVGALLVEGLKDLDAQNILVAKHTLDLGNLNDQSSKQYGRLISTSYEYTMALSKTRFSLLKYGYSAKETMELVGEAMDKMR